MPDFLPPRCIAVLYFGSPPRPILAVSRSMKDQLTLEDSADSIRLQTAWQQVLKRLSPDVPQAWYERFLKPLRPMSIDGNTVTVAVPGRFIMEWVRERYVSALQGLLADELGHSVSVELHLEARERQPIPAPSNLSLA